jgi:plastocyanin
MKKLLIVALIIAAAFSIHLISGKPRANATVDVQAGDLIRGETFSAVYYYGMDGFRYVFPNSSTYFTWYDNFDNVEFISDAQLGDIPIGGNVTYRPGVKMIKIQSDPKTYAVGANGTLHHVATEAIAVSLYGANWNQQIDDVPDAFFGNYSVDIALSSSAEFNKTTVTSAASSVNVNKGLQAPIEISISDSGYTPSSVTIDTNRVVRFTNNGTEGHTATDDNLDWGSGTLQPGKTFQRQFEDSGTFTFHDSYNTQSTGAIFVN